MNVCIINKFCLNNDLELCIKVSKGCLSRFSRGANRSFRLCTTLNKMYDKPNLHKQGNKQILQSSEAILSNKVISRISSLCPGAPSSPLCKVFTADFFKGFFGKEKLPFHRSSRNCESYSDGIKETICYLRRVFKAYFVLLLCEDRSDV